VLILNQPSHVKGVPKTGICAPTSTTFIMSSPLKSWAFPVTPVAVIGAVPDRVASLPGLLPTPVNEKAVSLMSPVPRVPSSSLYQDFNPRVTMPTDIKSMPAISKVPPALT